LQVSDDLVSVVEDGDVEGDVFGIQVESVAGVLLAEVAKRAVLLKKGLACLPMKLLSFQQVWQTRTGK